jgi:hypothetical protein
MPTGVDGVRFQGETGSSLPTAKVTRLTYAAVVGQITLQRGILF